MTLQLDAANFEETLATEQTVLVDFYTPTWPPCKQLGPVVDELAAKNEGHAVIAKVDVSEHMDLATKYGITGVPTILVFNNGEITSRELGFKSLNELQTLIDGKS